MKQGLLRTECAIPSVMDAAASGGFSAETIAGDVRFTLRLASDSCVINSTYRAGVCVERFVAWYSVEGFVANCSQPAGRWFRNIHALFRSRAEIICSSADELKQPSWPFMSWDNLHIFALCLGSGCSGTKAKLGQILMTPSQSRKTVGRQPR